MAPVTGSDDSRASGLFLRLVFCFSVIPHLPSLYPIATPTSECPGDILHVYYFHTQELIIVSGKEVKYDSKWLLSVYGAGRNNNWLKREYHLPWGYHRRTWTSKYGKRDLGFHMRGSLLIEIRDSVFSDCPSVLNNKCVSSLVADKWLRSQHIRCFTSWCRLIRIPYYHTS